MKGSEMITLHAARTFTTHTLTRDSQRALECMSIRANADGKVRGINLVELDEALKKQGLDPIGRIAVKLNLEKAGILLADPNAYL